MTGCWIALEGVEGCGKSTQARLLATAIGAVLTREPGATSLGQRLRGLLLDPATARIDPRAEALLMAADRAQHIAEVVRPALARGRDVVSDRSAYSFLAYQGYGRGLELTDLRWLTDWATDGLWPDKVMLVDVPAKEAAARMSAAGGQPDRLESEGGGFHDRVRAGFAALAGAEPDRWIVIDGTGTPDAVAARVRAAWDQRPR